MRESKAAIRVDVLADTANPRASACAHFQVSCVGKERRMNAPAQNTDRELWRLNPDSYYSPSIHVTAENSIGISVGGHVIVMPVEKWHEIGLEYCRSIERFTS